MAQQCLLMWTHTVMWVAAATTSGITAPSLPTHDFLDLVLTVGHEASLKASWKKNQNKTAISSYIPQGFQTLLYSILFRFSYLAMIQFLKGCGSDHIHHRLTLVRDILLRFSYLWYAEGYFEKISPGNYQLSTTANNNKTSFHLKLSGCFQVKDFIFALDHQDNCLIFSLCFASGLNVTVSFESFIWFGLLFQLFIFEMFLLLPFFFITCNQGN